MSLELAVLTTMITPAVLISACGALILSSSVRLGRVVDRVRALSDRFEELAGKQPGEMVLFEAFVGTILLGFEATLALRSGAFGDGFPLETGDPSCPRPAARTGALPEHLEPVSPRAHAMSPARRYNPAQP